MKTIYGQVNKYDVVLDKNNRKYTLKVVPLK